MAGLPRWLSGKESACQAGDMGSIPGSGRSAVEENGNPLQYSCLGNPMDRRAWWATGNWNRNLPVLSGLILINPNKHLLRTYYIQVTVVVSWREVNC